MTKEKLKEDYEKFASRPDMYDVWTAHSTDVVFDWFYSKLQEIRGEDIKKVNKVIKERIKWYSGEGNQPIRTALSEVLDLIKQETPHINNRW